MFWGTWVCAVKCTIDCAPKLTDCKIIIFTRLTPCLFAIGATPKETQLNCHRGAVKELFLRYQNTNQFLHIKVA